MGASVLERALVALLFAAEQALDAAALAELLQLAAAEEEWSGPSDLAAVEGALSSLSTGALSGAGGLELVRLDGGWRLRTAPDLGPLLRRLWPDRVLRLSRAALETLAVVAYRQPCTRAEIEAVRGVDCGAIVRNLMDRQLLRIIGRKDEPGRPLLYGTTPQFLETFSLDGLGALPTLRDLDALRAEQSSREKGLEAASEGVEP